MKDREAQSKLRSSEKLLRSHVITRCFLSAKAVEFNFSRNIMQTEFMAQ